MKRGQLFRLKLPDGRYAAGKIIALEDGVVGVALAAALWDCAPGELDVRETDFALDHIPLAPNRLADAEFIGEAPIEAHELEGGYALWAASSGPRTVVDAPLEALLGALG